MVLTNGNVWAEEPSATPYRPTVSNPADLPFPGHFEIEAGWQSTEGGADKRRSSAPWLLKYAFTENFGVLVGGESALSVTSAANNTERGNGDTSLTFKFKFPRTKTSAFGLEAGRKFPTASTRVGGSNEEDYTVNGIYSTEIKDLTFDVNANITRLGLEESGLARNQLGWALGVSRSLSGPWGGALELAGTRRNGTDSTQQILAAVSYKINSRVVIDFGHAWGLNNASPDTAAFAGVTLLFK